ncbi:MAG: hypothetical protein U5K79_13960 [Cyclobacteriaceae bacterium]|nr:hypothetical protein [Cyclobacteriaceae bacterium]
MLTNMKGGLLVIVALLAFMTGCSEKAVHHGTLLFTQAPGANVSVESILSGGYKYADGLRIVQETSGSMEILTDEFTSARAPEISYDGEIMVFSGKKTTADAWQIWTLAFDTKSLTQVTSTTENCTDPVWLPDGRIAFSKQITDDSQVKFHALFTIDPSGCCEQRITFQPHDDMNASVMNDGRLLFSSRQVYPERGALKYLAMRPDGTKAEIFYLPDSSVNTLNRACDTGAGKIAFSETGIYRTINFSRPMHSQEKPLIHGVDYLQSASSMEGESIMCSILKSGSPVFGIAMINKDSQPDTSSEIHDAANHLIEAVVVRSRELPRKLPSLMNMDDPSGYIVCLNAEASTIPADLTYGKSSKIQVLDYTGLIGETEIESDGSFYVALPADQPLRFQTVNSEGKVVRGPSSWIWVRPSERRGCVGCHEDSEITPENVVPKAVEKAPVAMIK